jgi:hypothetical protein
MTTNIILDKKVWKVQGEDIPKFEEGEIVAVPIEKKLEDHKIKEVIFTCFPTSEGVVSLVQNVFLNE